MDMMDDFSSISKTRTPAKIQPLYALGERRKAIWESLNSQRKTGQFSNVILECKGGILHGHKSVLVSLGSYFTTLFTTGLSESTQDPFIVDFTDFPIAAVSAVLDIVYSSEIISTDLLMDILRFADYVHSKWLQDLIVDYVRPFINVDNVLEWYYLSKQYRIAKLTSLTQHCIRENRRTLWWRAWAGSVKIDHIIKEAFQQELPVKEVVLVNKGGDLIVVDPEEGKYYPCAHADLLRLNAQSEHSKNDTDSESIGNVLLTFVHQKVFYVVCRCKWENPGLHFLRYIHCQKTFELECFLDFVQIYNLVSGTKENTYFVTASYDGSNALYLEFLSDSGLIYYFKFDMVSKTLYNGFITLTEAGGIAMNDLHCGKPTYLVGQTFIVNLDNFDFRSEDNHCPVKEDINPDDYIPEADELTGEMMNENFVKFYISTKKGFYWIYCIVDEVEPRKFMILKLDVKNRCWLPFCTFVGNLFHCFVCNDVLYLICTKTYKRPHVVKKVLRLDEDKIKVETTSLNVPLFRESSVIPHHVL